MKASTSVRFTARSFLVLLAACGLVSACSGSTGTDAGDASDTNPIDVVDAADATTDSSDAAIDVVTAVDVSDAGEEAGTDASDTGSTDASDVTDGGGTVSFMAMVHVSSIAENCQPVVATDPLQVEGTVDITNIGTASIGPITSMTGSILTDSGMEIATFGIAPISISPIAPGASGSAMFTKSSGTLMPAMGCSTVACNANVRVAVDISGPNIPSGTRAISAISHVDCVF